MLYSFVFHCDFSNPNRITKGDDLVVVSLFVCGNGLAFAALKKG